VPSCIVEHEQNDALGACVRLFREGFEERPARERLVNFLTPEQLTKWDKEVAKAKGILGIG
jgi:hypothetical protein